LAEPALLNTLLDTRRYLDHPLTSERRLRQEMFRHKVARFVVSREQSLLVQGEIDKGMAEIEDHRLDQGLTFAETREGKREGAADVLLAFGPDSAAVCLYPVAGDEQAETGSTGLHRARIGESGELGK
jgi:hypothetical protein